MYSHSWTVSDQQDVVLSSHKFFPTESILQPLDSFREFGHIDDFYSVSFIL